MKNKKKKKKNQIFNSIRKQIAPGSIKMKNKKRSKKADATGRKDKYKTKPE